MIGNADPLFTRVRAYFHDKLPANPQTRLLEVGGGHVETPEAAREQVVAWIKEVAGQP